MSYKPLLIKGPVYVTISSTVRGPDIRALAIAAGWVGYEAIVCTVNAGVDVISLNIPSTIPAGLLTIINRGRIGGVINSGTGMVVRTNISIDNSSGTIFGGGGKGGAGGSILISNPNSPGFQARGVEGAGGNGAGFSQSTLTFLNANPGDAGTTVQVAGPTTGGVGTSTGGAGGTGGNIGTAGNTGVSGTAAGNYNTVQVFPPLAGVAAGNYLDGNAYVNWLAFGTRLGNVI